MEIETKVETYRIDKKCDKCKEGNMICTGEGFTQWYTTWKHKCDKCGEYDSYQSKSYPITEYRDIGKPKERMEL